MHGYGRGRERKDVCHVTSMGSERIWQTLLPQVCGMFFDTFSLIVGC